MTGPKGEKITAKAYSAASQVASSVGPLDWGDKCFLCSNTINIDTPPVDSRGFYVSRNGGMLLCHQKCLDEMNAAGGHPKDFHAARQAAGKASTPSQAPPEPVPPTEVMGSSWLEFQTLQDMQAFIEKQGPIAPHVKVTVGGGLVQPGE